MKINLGDIVKSKSDGRLWWVDNHLWSSMVWTIVDINGDTRSIASHQEQDYTVEERQVSRKGFEQHVNHWSDERIMIIPAKTWSIVIDERREFETQVKQLTTLYNTSQARVKRLEDIIQAIDVGYDTPRSKYL